MALYYVWRNCAGAVFVKEASFFASQGGLTEPWGAAWTAVEAESVEAARDLGKAMGDFDRDLQVIAVEREHLRREEEFRSSIPPALARVVQGLVPGVGDEDG